MWTIRARRRAVGAEFFWGKFAVAVFVECLERFGSAFEFGGRNGAVVIGIQRRNQGRDGWLVRRWILGLPFPVRRRWHAAFLRGDFAITVLVEFSEHIGRGFDLSGGQLPVVIRVEDGNQRRDRWRPPVAAWRRWLGRGGDTRREGEYPMKS